MTLFIAQFTFSETSQPEIRLGVVCISASSASHLAFIPDILKVPVKEYIVKQSQKSS
jgi:hypothetical protein